MTRNRWLVLAVVVVAALAGVAAVGGEAGEESEQPITGGALRRASEAALAHTGGGRVTDTEAGDEDGAYEVEVTLDGGRRVDVHLDGQFRVVGTEDDGTAADDDEGDGGGGAGAYDPDIDPDEFTTRVTNPFLPLTRGTRWVYQGTTADGEVERIVVEVTARTRRVMGVETLVVRDTVTIAGELAEDTFDWFAQDADGNVWYFGEDTKEYEDGEVVSTAGSWEAGVGGAKPGIVMLAQPRVGERYRQEYAPGEAEDEARVVDLDGEAVVPFASFDDLLVTEDFTRLDPRARERKYYASGVGLVLEEAVGGKGRVELVEVTRAR